MQTRTGPKILAQHFIPVEKRAPYKITAWKIIFQRAYSDNAGNPRTVKNVFQSRSIVRAGSSGISADCGILYNTPGKKRFSLKKRRRLF